MVRKSNSFSPKTRGRRVPGVVLSHSMQNPLRLAQHPPFGPVQARRTPRSTVQHARFYHYQRPVSLTSTPTHQSKPIGHTLRNGLVQNIFSSPARLVYVSALLTPTVATPSS